MLKFTLFSLRAIFLYPTAFQRMRIAINTRFLSSPNLEGLGRFAYETSKWMTEQHPEHEYFFIFDREFDPRYIGSDRITPIVIRPPARHPFLWYLWYEWALPRALRKHKIDLFISTDGLGSLRSKTPSCVVIHDLAFEHFPEQVSYFTRQYYRYFIPKYAKASAALATVSEATRKDIMERYEIAENKIAVVESACPGYFRALSDEEKQLTKQKYTGSCDFFIYVGAIHPRKNVLRIIQAFALFRQQQECPVKLVLVGRKAWMTGNFEEQLAGHPYKEDIIHLQHIDKEELLQLVGSAMASLYPSLLEGFGLPILEAQKSHVPVITSNCSPMPEVAGDAALFADPYQVNDIADKMTLLYSDEQLRNTLIQKGSANWQRYSWERTAELLYNCAMTALER